jgi:hypothetical protein
MKRAILTALVSAAALLAVQGAAAAPGLFDADATKPIESKYCDQTAPIVVWVTQLVMNDVDSGVAGNAWAVDKYAREILVRRTGHKTYCAALRYYDGAFATVAGISPGGTGFVSDGISGTLTGGYKTVNFRARFRPLAPTSGDIGVADFACDLSFTCPGAVSWLDLYFTDVQGFALDWWAWIYDAGANGLWVNRSTGNSGDILG